MSNIGKPVGVAVVGCGRVSSAHLGAICAQPDFGRLVAVVDPDMERARKQAAEYGALHTFSSIEEAIQCEEIEAFDLCLPNHTHGDAAIQCLNAGRSVLVEKPMADDARTAEKMAEAADRAGKILATAQNRRHSSAIRYVQDNLSRFGNLRSIEASFCMYWPGPQAPWWTNRTRKQGLVLSLLGSHTVDFVQMMFGHHPVRVHAEAARWRDCWSADDEAMILLRYPENRMATVHISYNQRPVFERYYLLFDECFVEIRDVNTVLINDEIVHLPPDGEDEIQLVTNESFKIQFAEFAAAVRGLPNRSALHPQGLALMRVLDAAIQSAITEKTVNIDWVLKEVAAA